MITDKKFIVTNGEMRSTRTFNVWSGLQQGTVNSPILFNIYTSDLLKSLNNGIAFADDLGVYRAARRVEEIERLLQNDFDVVQNYCKDWKLKINIKKCEIILFRTPLSRASRNIKRNWKNIKIIDHTGQQIEQKTQVKYLGINLDQFLYFNNHINTQIKKAQSAFNLVRRLFFSKHLDTKVKIIAYQTLIRPIIVYGCPVWFNVSPNYMERIRVFERQCLRACLSMYRDPDSGYTYHFSNKKLYDSANLNRIDNFIIRQIRNHFARAATIQNSLIMGPTIPQNEYHEKAICSGFVPPESFMYLDSKGMIQDELGVPVLYHWHRAATNKKIDIPPNTSSQNSSNNWRFVLTVSDRDLKERQKLKLGKYFWLQDRID